MAPVDGVVYSTKIGGDWGKQVRIETASGLVVMLAHLSVQLVTVGQRVKAGQIVGRVGHTGYTIGRTGDHLHIEFWTDRNWLHTIDLWLALEAARLGSTTGGGFLMGLTDHEQDVMRDQIRDIHAGIGADVVRMRALLEKLVRETESGKGDFTDQDADRLESIVAEIVDNDPANRFVARVDQKTEDIRNDTRAIRKKVGA